jgi:hypothetical protein
MIKRTLKTDLRLKNGKVIPKGTEAIISWPQRRIAPRLEIKGRQNGITMGNRSLHKYFSGFRACPSVSTMKKWANDGMAQSVLGSKVELDGRDSLGSPSWILVEGLI